MLFSIEPGQWFTMYCCQLCTYRFQFQFEAQPFKQACRAVCRHRPHATQQIGKIHPFSKVAVTFEQMQFPYNLTFKMSSTCATKLGDNAQQFGLGGAMKPWKENNHQMTYQKTTVFIEQPLDLPWTAKIYKDWSQSHDCVVQTREFEVWINKNSSTND